jgi:hypothetical protein
MKVLALRRDDQCVVCSAVLQKGARAVWDQGSRTVRCLACADGHPVPPWSGNDTSGAEVTAPAAIGGASGQREHDRRAKRREERIRAQHPRLGGLILALADEPASIRVWAQGARGERAVAAKLDELAGEHIVALHDRALRRPDGRLSRANIDHLVVAANGVWVVDAKTHTGTLEVRRSGGLFSSRTESLYVRGRDRTKLVHGLARQVAAVTAQLVDVDAPILVRGALCFVGTELPWFGDSLGGVPLVGRRGLAKLLKRPGGLTAEDRENVARFLAGRFPPAL